MKLYYTPNSPFARIARIALRESGLVSSVSELVAANRQPDNPVLHHSPIGRVPVLVDGDIVITETKHVFDYIAEISKSLDMQEAASTDWKEIGQQGQILGFIEGIASWVRENRRNPEIRSDFLTGVEFDRSKRCLSYLDREAVSGQLPNFPVFRGVVLASGLGLMDLHEFHLDWRTDYSFLAAWFDRQAGRSSMRETAPML